MDFKVSLSSFGTYLIFRFSTTLYLILHVLVELMCRCEYRIWITSIDVVFGVSHRGHVK